MTTVLTFIAGFAASHAVWIAALRIWKSSIDRAERRYKEVSERAWEEHEKLERIDMATVMTLEQQKRSIEILHSVADGCAFASSRAFKGGTCAQENGRGFNCTPCAARTLLKEMGEKSRER